LKPIPTPLYVRWSLFRSRWLPAITLTVAIVLSGMVWSRVAGAGHAVGEVERIKTVVSSVVEGRLDYVNGRQLKLLEHVEEGDVVARIDDTSLRAQVEAAQAEVKLLQEQLKAATASAAGADTADRVNAMRVSIAAKEEQLSKLDGKLDALEIKSPISGTVTQIHARPGQYVQAGHPILEVASERGTSIVAFIRAEQQILPREGMEVEVRTASDPYHSHAAKVESVAGQYDSVPTRLLRDPKTPEWGIPVRVTLPQDVSVRPGELVRVTFRSRPFVSKSSASTETPDRVSVAQRPGHSGDRSSGKSQADARD
jgi:multidrug resistance efflux pump